MYSSRLQTLTLQILDKSKNKKMCSCSSRGNDPSVGRRIVERENAEGAEVVVEEGTKTAESEEG
jgi:hypothetical protein